MLSETDQLLRVMRAARMTREEAEAELDRELVEAKPLIAPSLSDPEYIRELRALASIQNTEALLNADKPDGAKGRRGSKKRTVTIDLGAYERDKEFIGSRQVARRQHEEYAEALRARLGRLDEASRPLHTTAVKSPLQRYIDALERS